MTSSEVQTIVFFEPPTNPVSAPGLQMMSKRIPSVTVHLHLVDILPGQNIQSVCTHLSVENRLKILHSENRVYGVVCRDVVQENRTNKPISKFGRAIFMVCPLNIPFDQAYQDLKTQVTQSNLEWSQKLDPSLPENLVNELQKQQIYINRSRREEEGLQGRFYIPVENEELDIEKLEVII